MRGRVAATVDSPAWDADGSCRAGDVTVQATRVTAQTAASIQRMAGRAPRPFPGDMIPSNRSASQHPFPSGKAGGEGRAAALLQYVQQNNPIEPPIFQSGMGQNLLVTGALHVLPRHAPQQPDGRVEPVEDMGRQQQNLPQQVVIAPVGQLVAENPEGVVFR